MNAKHTPGPWPIFDNSGLTLKRSITVTIGNRKFVFYNGDNLADAHLIAAAPDLLEAIKELAFRAEAHGMNADEANSAIDKAEGGAA